MTIKNLVELVNNNKNKILKAEQLQTILKKELEVKDYLGIKEKKKLVEDIVNECILYNNGIFKFDEIEKYITFTMKTIEAYTNIELSLDIEEDYDMLCKNNMLDIVIALFRKEYDEVSILLQMRCDYILSDNNVEAQVNKFLNEVLDKTNDLTDFFKDKVGNFDIKHLPIKPAELKQILDFIDKQNR